MIGDIDWFGMIVGGTADGDITANAKVAKAMIRNGLAVVMIEPGRKLPVCTLTARDAKRADIEAQNAARETGAPNWDKVKHACGIKHALTEEKQLNGARVKHWLKEGANLAISPGHSSRRVIIVDVDTQEQRRAFLRDWAYTLPDDSDESLLEAYPMTVSSPGVMDTSVGGERVWTHKDGGHFWFDVPDEIELPERPGKLTWCKCHGVRQPRDGCTNAWAAYYSSGYVLIPPSVRPEGPYRLTGDVQTAPGWLTDLIRESRTPEREDGRTGAVSAFSDDPIDDWSARVSWHDLLTADGFWPNDFDNCGCQTFTRPGSPVHSKSVTAHEIGCTIYDTSAGHGPLHVWSDALGSGTMSKLTYVAKFHYDGDTRAAMKALDLTRMTSNDSESDDDLAMFGLTAPKGIAPDHGADTEAVTQAKAEESVADDLFDPIDWDELFDADVITADHLAGQLLESGQQIALVGDGKSGKSLLMAEWCLKSVTGAEFLGHCANRPIVVMYLDAENSRRDLIMRVRSLGGTPDQLRGKLVYLSFPPFKPLDGNDGALQVMALVDKYKPDVVVLDTVSRFIKGKENDADTWLALYRVLHKRLKALRIACVRLDHFGKDAERGGRGSSAKSQDIDHVWELSETGEETRPMGNGVTEVVTQMELKRTHTRTGLGPGFIRVSRTGQKTDVEWLANETHHDRGDVFDGNPFPTSTREQPAQRPNEIMWSICDLLTTNPNGLIAREIEKQVAGRTTTVRYAIELLLEDGNIKREQVGRAQIHTLIKHMSDVI